MENRTNVVKAIMKVKACGGISKDEWFQIVDKMYALYHWKEV